jgi:hypothetical protein
MLTCRDVTESATDYMERTLSRRESLQVRLHLLMCGFCRLYIRQLATTRDLLRRLPRSVPPDQDVQSLLGAYRSRTDEDEGERR